MWLNIGVREGASSGGYTGLLPRQKITATPFALYSESVAAGAVGSNEIDATQVQRRVSSSYAVGTYITAINQDGSVTCATDMVGLSSVTGAEVVDGTIGAIDIDPTQSYTLGVAIINGATNINGALTVSGQTEVGLVRVSSSFTLDSTNANCHSHGNLTCYYGSGSVQCPVGTRVLGGGTSGHSALFGSLSTSYPNSSTSWTCGLSYDLAGVTRTCYAICARLE